MGTLRDSRTFRVFLSLTLAAIFSALLSGPNRVVYVSESETAGCSDGSDSSCDPAAALAGVDLETGLPGSFLLIHSVFLWTSRELSYPAAPADLFSSRAYASRAPPLSGLIQLLSAGF